MSDQEHTSEDMSGGKSESRSASGGGGYGQKGQDSQPSPLALLAATCSRIEPPENGNGGVQQQNATELDLSTAQIQQTANGWQIISAPSISSKDQAGGDASSKNRPIAPGQFVVTTAPNMQNQQVLASLQSVMPNIQYQVIPQFQTVDGQQLQFTTAPGQLNVQQDASGQLQIIPANQQIMTTNRAGAGNILTMPNLLQQAVPIQGMNISNNVLSGQTQYLTNVPVSLNGNITLLPMNAASLTPTSQSVTLGSQENGSQAVTTVAMSSSGQLLTSQANAYFTNANSYSTSTTPTNMGIVNCSVGSTQGTNVQIQASQRSSGQLNMVSDAQQGGTLQGQQKDADQAQQQQQQQILIQPQILQGGQTIQTLQAAQLGGQTYSTQAVSQDALQNIQIQTVPNTGPILLRTIGPNGQVTWQTIQLQNLQVQNPQAQTITLAPMQGVSLGQTGNATSMSAGTVTVNAAQLSSMPGLQTINLGALGASGIQVHQLQGVPLTITNAGGQPGYPGNPAYPPTGTPGYPPGQPVYPPGQPVYPPGQPVYPPGQPVYPPGQTVYPPGQPGYPGPSPAYPGVLPHPGQYPPGMHPGMPGVPLMPGQYMDKKTRKKMKKAHKQAHKHHGYGRRSSSSSSSD
uniref:Sp1 transcription factor n=1 Tax=Leptobrachium leishanense TaxID=445787 RepID=A0A8C5M629_9ANUR